MADTPTAPTEGQLWPRGASQSFLGSGSGVSDSSLAALVLGPSQTRDQIDGAIQDFTAEQGDELTAALIEGPSLTREALATRLAARHAIEGIFNVKTDAVGATSVLLMADHTQFLRDAITLAGSLGSREIIIPSLDPTDPTRPWILSGQLEPYAYSRISAETATFRQTTPLWPAFHLAPGINHVGIHVLRAYLDETGTGTRPLYAVYPTVGIYNLNTGARSNSCGVRVDSEFVSVTGHFEKFRFGVRCGSGASSMTTQETLRKSNRIDITVDEVDFGIAFGSQTDGYFKVHGRFVQTSDSPDPAHLIYGTAAPFNTTNNVVAFSAWDSLGDSPGSFRAQNGLQIQYAMARNCSGILNILDARGSTVIDTIHGVDILSEIGVGTGAVPAVRVDISSAGAGDATLGGTVTIGTAKIAFKPGIGTSSLRAFALGDDVNIGHAEVTYSTDTADNNASMFHIFGSRSTLGTIKIRNAGVGGIRGIRYVSGTHGHYMATAPNIVRCTDGITIDPPLVEGGVATNTGVVGSTFTIDEQSIIPITGYSPLVVAIPNITNSIRTGGAFARRQRANRFFAVPVGPTITVTPAVGNMMAVSLVLQFPTRVTSLSARVTFGVADAFLRLGVYMDNGAGMPGALVYDAGAVDASSTGTKTASFAALTLPAGAYWLVAAAQGMAGASYTGVAASTLDSPAVSADAAIVGTALYASGVSGALPGSFGTVLEGASQVKLSYGVPLS